MKNAETNSKTALEVFPKAENQKGIENHKTAALHFASASKHHLEPAKHHEEGDHDKALKSTIVAHGHASLAKEAQRNDVKHHRAKC